MVAPTSETANQGSTLFQDPSFSRDVSKLPRAIYASTSLAPDLHLVIRKKLEEQQIDTESQNLYLAAMKSLPRYDRAFKLFWAFCRHRGLDPIILTLSQISSLLLQFDKLAPSQARHAYAALLHIPGYDHLRFSSILKPCKRKWNTSEARYTTFWDGTQILRRLATQPLDIKNVTKVRARLILA